MGNKIESKNESNDGNVLAYIDDTGACKIKLVGEIRYNSNVKGFMDFVSTKVAEEKITDVVVDLRKCDYIDSANIGVLAKITALQQQKNAKKPTLIYPEDSKVYDTIDDVKIHQLFELRIDKEGQENLDFDYQELPREETTQLEIAKIMLATHKHLSDLNDSNKEKFKSVVKYLSESILKK
jgi:anti-anti-sigma factor